MKRLLLATILLVGMIFAFYSTAEAQGVESSQTSNITVAKLFPWATNGSIDWGQGGLFLGLGFIGALVTVFTLIGGAVPGTEGKVKIDQGEETLAIFTNQLTKLVQAEQKNPEAIKAVEQATNELRDDLNAEKWRQFGLGALIYLLLGAFFASMLAQNLIEALAIGAGWTGVIGTLGLKLDYKKRKEAKDDAIDKLLEKMQAAEPIQEQIQQQVRIARVL